MITAETRALVEKQSVAAQIHWALSVVDNLSGPIELGLQYAVEPDCDANAENFLVNLVMEAAGYTNFALDLLMGVDQRGWLEGFKAGQIVERMRAR